MVIAKRSSDEFVLLKTDNGLPADVNNFDFNGKKGESNGKMSETTKHT